MLDISVIDGLVIFLWLVFMIIVAVKLFNDWEAIDKSEDE